MTHRTLSEIRATCTKAARGNMAAKRLQSHGLPGAEALATLFDTLRDCTGADTQTICGIKALAALSDDPSSLPKGAVAAPLLLLAAFLEEDAACKIDFGSAHAVCSSKGIQVTGNIPPIAKVALSNGSLTNATRPTWHSRPVDDAAWAKLLSLAAKTYVPETDQSRAAGAGPSDAQDD